MMDPIKRQAAYERADTLQRIAAEIRIARTLRTPTTETPAVALERPTVSERPATAPRRERCPGDLAQPRPA
jgi:hypothetical protein